MGLSTSKVVLLSVLAVLLFAAGGFTYWAVTHNDSKKIPYALLDSSIEDMRVDRTIINFDPLRQDLKDYFNKLGLSHSFYFEYLPNGVNIRNGDDNTTVAASLMKTPVVMDLYKLAESGTVNLDTPVDILPQDISTDTDYGDPSGLLPGTTTTLREAAKLALHNSDNTAITIIKRNVTPLLDADSEVVNNLDITYDTTGDKPTDKLLTISARSYSSILKCLYYSCFLQPKDSQEVLSYLVGSIGTNRLTSSVPGNIQVAHKVGSNGAKAQSDCGIIYQPGKPYLVCLMFWDYPNISGDETAKYFKQVSKIIHDYVSSK